MNSPTTHVSAPPSSASHSSSTPRRTARLAAGGKSTRRALYSGLLAAALVSLTSCGGAAGGGGSGGNVIRIGVVVSQTGPDADLGAAEAKVVELYKNELSKVPGGRVEWILADDASQASGAVKEVNRLIGQRQAAAIVCCTVTPTSLAIQPVIQQAKVPNIALAAARAIVEPAASKPLFFKTAYNDNVTETVAVQDMKSRGVKKVAFLYVDNAYGQSGLTEFRKLAGQNGLTVTGAQAFQATDTSVSSQITKAKAGNPDAYVIWGIPPAANVVQRDLHNLAPGKPVYQSFGVATREFIKLGGPAVEGTRIAGGRLLVWNSLKANDPHTQKITEFARKYNAKHGPGSVNPFAGNAYDSMLIVHAAVTRTLQAGVKPGNRVEFAKKLRDEIENTRGLTGVTGVFNYSRDDHAGLGPDSVTMIEVRGGQFLPAKTEADRS
jgi:branched-chain amino acid transport system substrate-binding protein